MNYTLSDRRTLFDHQEAVVLCAEGSRDLDILDSGEIMDMGLDGAEVVTSAVVGVVALPARTCNLLELLDTGFSRIGELTTRKTIDLVRVLVIPIVLG